MPKASLTPSNHGQPIWACRSDHIPNMVLARRAGADISGESIKPDAEKRMQAMDQLPKELRSWIHEHGRLNTVYNEYHRTRSISKSILAGQKALDAIYAQTSQLLGHRAVTVDDLGL